MRTAASMIAALTLAGSAFADHTRLDVFADSSNDLFDNGFANLDITQVAVGQFWTGDHVELDIAVTTRGMSDWTKYLLFFDTQVGGLASNPWNRPINTGGGVDAFVGGWIDSGGGDQYWSAGESGWNGAGGVPIYVDWNSNTVHYMFGLAVDLAAVGTVIKFDVATSGGGSNDPGVDHLSRSDQATSGWGSASASGEFLSFTVIPAPGAAALLAVAGLVGRRRR